MNGAQMSVRLEGLIDELAQALGATATARSQAAASPAAQERCWIATFDVAGDRPGRCEISIDAAGASALAHIKDGGDTEPNDAVVGALLRDACTTAIAAMAVRPAEEAMLLTLAGLTVGSTAMNRITAAFTLTAPGVPAPFAAAALWIPAPGAPNKPVAARSAARGEPEVEDRIDVILDIDLPVVVRFGRTELPIRALTKLGPGSVIDLGRSPDDPVELLVSDRVVAHGEVVIVGGNYGLRILDVASPGEMIRPMEAGR